jgi:O-antigen/teichoic acid export membrane protein
VSDQEPALEAGAVAEADVLDSADAGNKVIRGGGLRVLGYVSGLVIGLVSAPLLVRHLSVSDFGAYATVTSITFVIGGLVEGGLGNVAIRRYAAEGPEDRTRLLDALFGLRLVMVTAGVLLALAFTVAVGYRWEVTAGTAIVGAGLVLGGWQNTLAVALQASLKLGSLAGADLARQIASTVVIVALVVAGTGLVPFFVASPIAFVAMLVATLRAGGRDLRLRPRVDLGRWGALLRETSLYAAATALGVLYFQVAIISTSLLASSKEAGFYAAAFRIVDIANGVPWLLASSAFPILARAAQHDADRLRYATDRLYQAALTVGGGFCVAIAVGAEFGLEVVGGSKLDPAIPTLRLLAFGVPFTFLVATWAFTLLSLHAVKGLLVANATAVVVALGLSVALIPGHGAQGAAITTMVLEVVLAGMYAIALTRARADLRPTLGILPRVGVSLGAALAAGFLLPLPVVPATIVALVVYAGLALLTGALPEEILIALHERLPALRSRGG